MTTAEVANLLAAVAADDAAEEQRKNNKIEKIKDVLRKYFENDPWTEEPDPDYDDMMSAEEAIYAIVEILK